MVGGPASTPPPRLTSGLTDIPKMKRNENIPEGDNMKVSKNMNGWYHITTPACEADVFVSRGRATRAKVSVDGTPTPAHIYVSDSSGGWIPVSSAPFEALRDGLGHTYEVRA